VKSTEGILVGWTRRCVFLLLLLGSSAGVVRAQYPEHPQIAKDGTAVLLEDYASLPLSSGTLPGAKKGVIDFKGQLGRATALRSEPANAPLAASRFFVDDQSGTLYILDKKSKEFTPYLHFDQIFPNLASGVGGPSGIISFAFDPNYAKNGKFYTVHSERPGKGPGTPVNAEIPALDLSGYALTPSVNRLAAPARLECALIEWTDTNIRNSTFEGTARELLRVGFYRGGHIMGDLIFNPLARPGDADYENLYIS